MYVHFPWCIKKCPYCDFLSVPSARKEIPHEHYADALISEIAQRRAELGPQRVRSIFFGGGTPSLWRVRELGRVLRAILGAFDTELVVREGANPAPEVTVECNPGSLGYDTARALFDVGVNRLSIGVQALDDERLRFLGRWHDAERALTAVREAVRSGMPRVSADLIFGVAGQSPESAAEEARRLVELGLNHLSSYALTIEPQTAFGALARKGRLPLAPEPAVADSFLAVDEALASVGLEHYEISNFARGAHYAIHNIGYWRGDEYLGLGAGAWGTIVTPSGRVRYRNTPSPERYLDRSLAFGPLTTDHERGLVQQLEPIDGETALRERLLLGLRLRQGIDLEAMAAELGVEPWPRE